MENLKFKNQQYEKEIERANDKSDKNDQHIIELSIEI